MNKQKCTACGGEGRFVTTVMQDFGHGDREETRCDKCCGSGVIYTNDAAPTARDAGTIDGPEFRSFMWNFQHNMGSVSAINNLIAHIDLHVADEKTAAYGQGYAQGWQDSEDMRNQPSSAELAKLRSTAGVGEAVAWRYRTKGGNHWQATTDPAVAGTLSGGANVEVRALVDAATAPVSAAPKVLVPAWKNHETGEAIHAPVSAAPEMRCSTCGADRLKDRCKAEHWQRCPMVGEAHVAPSAGAPVSAAAPRVTPEMTKALADAEAKLEAIQQRRLARQERLGLLTDKELADPEYMRAYVGEMQETIAELLAMRQPQGDALADGYQGGVVAGDGDGATIKLHYSTNAQGDAAFSIITDAIDAAIAAKQAGKEGA